MTHEFYLLWDFHGVQEKAWNISRFFMVCKFMGHDYPLNGEFVMDREDS